MQRKIIVEQVERKIESMVQEILKESPIKAKTTLLARSGDTVNHL